MSNFDGNASTDVGEGDGDGGFTSATSSFSYSSYSPSPSSSYQAPATSATYSTDDNNNGGGSSSNDTYSNNAGNTYYSSSSSQYQQQDPVSSSYSSQNYGDSSYSQGYGGQSQSSTQDYTSPSQTYYSSSSQYYDPQPTSSYSSSNNYDQYSSSSYYSSSQQQAYSDPNPQYSSSSYDNGDNGQDSASSSTISQSIVANSSATASPVLSINATDPPAVLPSTPSSTSLVSSTNASGAASAFSSDQDSTSHKSHLGKGPIAGIVVGFLVLAGVMAAVLSWRRKRKAQQSEREMEQIAYDGMDTAPPTPAGFVGFKDNASTFTSNVGSPRPGGYQAYESSPAIAAMLQPEGPDDDDASHYSNHDDASDSAAGHMQSSHYVQPQAAPYIPEYFLPSPPIPAFSNRNAMHSNEHLMVSPSIYTDRDLGSSRNAGSLRSQRAYGGDDRVRGLY